ncbi:hypothetical protein FNV43_RR15175 [Rhamnella rubrinervis]|uniref:Uncharacterized protein n=1 Tax=Rhamnella rubrinervis TaxID=2594499 RepID=A0A8K0ECG4_9ROSA|nr:hypothetical protein FNV43_RR15175 [Rhamnella rubrinervis]
MFNKTRRRTKSCNLFLNLHGGESFVDARIVKDEEGNEENMTVANLAKRCLNLNAKFGLTMKEAAMELEATQKSVEATAHGLAGLAPMSMWFWAGPVTVPSPINS